MSRRGRIPVVLPKGVEATASGRNVSVKGPKGSLQQELPEGIEAKVEDGSIILVPTSDDKDLRKFHGLARALVANMVQGLSTGFQKDLELIGVGFRAAVKGKQLDLQLGFSHPTLVDIPEGLEVKVAENTKVSVQGVDAQRVGQFAASVRALRPPEPYKGKGIRYAGEYVRRKAGKAGKAA